ncbi:MAG: heavy metal-binding domain-containing protein [Intrasporangiaceae bacterium]|nr:heavy metal-binding domain-containing protein [Intrasporangiaceae bacterium]
MLIVTTDHVPSHHCIEALGLVEGNTTVAKHVGRDLMAGLRNLVGGEVVQYTQLLADARGHVMERMREHAQRLEADAIVAVRFTTSTVADGAAELYGYGTAVRLEPTRNRENTAKP